MDQKKRKKRKHRLSMDEENEISFFDTLRKRKRRNTEEDGDNISIKSFSLRSSFRRRRESTVDLDTLSVQSFSMGTGYKRNRSLVKVSSFANLLSPVSSVKKVGQALQVCPLQGEISYSLEFSQ
ncbi:uncharacterized protein [Diadema antillarum]|uniref:uncharacterized protein n=1 Tax=Diadema antillarum TaxID=105358 RepID=UPI003A8618A3